MTTGVYTRAFAHQIDEAPHRRGVVAGRFALHKLADQRDDFSLLGLGERKNGMHRLL